jgi:hypothetical protein
MYCEFLKNENGSTIKNAVVIRWGDCKQFYTLQSYNDIIAEYNADMKLIGIDPCAFAISPTTEKTLVLFLKQYLHFDNEKINFIKEEKKQEYHIINSNGLTLTVKREKII